MPEIKKDSVILDGGELRRDGAQARIIRQPDPRAIKPAPRTIRQSRGRGRAPRI